MTRTLAGLRLLIVGGLLAGYTPLQAQADIDRLPVSINRIRAALKEQPPRSTGLAMSDEAPTFQVEVRQRLSILKPVEEKPFDPTYGLPSAGALVMSGVAKIQSALVDYKHSRAERRARREVEDALAAFCAIHECTPGTAAK